MFISHDQDVDDSWVDIGLDHLLGECYVSVWTTSLWVAVFENIPFAIETKIHLQSLVHDTIVYETMDLAPEIVKVEVIRFSTLFGVLHLV